MEMKEVYELWDRFEKSNVTKLELSISGGTLLLEKDRSASSINCDNKKIIADEANTVEIANKAETVENIDEVIKAPLVGTFFSAPSPEAEPFVTEGKTVKKGEVVGIIEAMKLMNEITAPYDCVIEKIHCPDETLVGYGDTLFSIRRS